jgi:hypothetical protein
MVVVVFIALGFAVIALMGLYATSLLIQIKAAIDFGRAINSCWAGKPANYMPRIFRAVVPNLASICGIGTPV